MQNKKNLQDKEYIKVEEEVKHKAKKFQFWDDFGNGNLPNNISTIASGNVNIKIKL